MTTAMRLRVARARRRDALADLSFEERAARQISRIVGLLYYVAALVIFRKVLLAVPDIITGRAVIVGDELVPFWNPTSQLFDQAAGDFSQLTHGYEFRVRYSFLTTWLRYYMVLPFAILLILPTIFFTVYKTVTWFMRSVFENLSPVSINLAVAFPTSFTYLIMVYAKVTHFYTLIVGLAMMTISVLFMLYAVLFAKERWVRYVVFSCLVTLLNPAVHYLVLFVVFVAIAGVTLLLGEAARWIRRGGVARLPSLPHRFRRVIRSPRRLRISRYVCRRTLGTTLGRAVVGGVLLVFVTVLPYALFVKYIALAGIDSLSETVPGDYYFIRDASVSWLHLLSWDLAGIMDKVLFGDYLAKVPRYPNIIYSSLLFLPLGSRPIRRFLLQERSHRQLLGVVYVAALFAMWATIGYAEPTWFPTFHRSLAAVTTAVYATDTPAGDLTLDLASAVVQVLRFPHRFQLILFMLAPLVMSMPIAWGIEVLHRRWIGVRDATQSSTEGRHWDSLVLRLAATAWLGTVFFVPFWSNEPYRNVFGSGDFGTFMAPYPVEDLKELKGALLALPEGKTVVLPPTETAKLTTDTNGIDHKFIDKFYIYFLDQPSFYYGLTGDAVNKFEFFLMLRGIYYQQDWWINPARDIGVRYLIVNRYLRDNYGVGAEYLPDVEAFTEPAILRQDRYVELRFQNPSFSLYELVDQPSAGRDILLIDSSWTEYLGLVFDRLDLSQCYNFEYLPYYEPDDHGEDPDLHLFTQNPDSAAVDLWALEQGDAYFTPSPKTFAFDSDVVSSAYYLSPMFRLFLFFSNTKWNRNEMITPGLFGTLRGSFVGVPRPTSFSIPATFPEDGEYRVLMRAAATANDIRVEASSLDWEVETEVRSPADALNMFSEATVYDRDRVPTNTDILTVEELEDQIGNGLVPVNVRYTYHDLGVIEATAGAHTFDVSKLDENPMLVEGIVLIPEGAYQEMGIRDGVTVVTSAADVECGTRYEVFGEESLGYVDPAAHDVHENLSNEELLSLAAAGVPGLEPDESGGIGDTWIVLGLTGALLFSAVMTVRSRTRPREDEAPLTSHASVRQETENTSASPKPADREDHP